MVVSGKILGAMVRTTAVHAYRACLLLQRSPKVSSTSTTQNAPIYVPPYSQRAADIRIINERHRTANWTYERVMESVFMSGAEGLVGNDDD